MAAGLLLLAGCNSAGFSRAQRLDTEDGWRAFLADSDNFGAEFDAARERLDERVWANADRIRTPLAYRRYLDEFPSGAHADDAEKRLASLRHAPEGPTSNLTDLDARESAGGPPGAADAALAAAAAGDLAPLIAYLVHHPDAPRAAELRDREDDLSFAAAAKGDGAALQRYLDAHPQGRHRAEALERVTAREVRALLWEERFVDADDKLQTLSPGTLRNQLGLELCQRQERAKQASDAALADLGSEGLALVLPNDGAVLAIARGLASEDRAEVVTAAWALADTALPSALDPLIAATDPDRVPSVRWVAQLAARRLGEAWPAEVRELELGQRRTRIASRAASAPLWIQQALLEEGLGSPEAQVTLSKARHDAPDDPLPLALSLQSPALRDPERSLVAHQLAVLVPTLPSEDDCARRWFDGLAHGGAATNGSGTCADAPAAVVVAAQNRRLAALAAVLKKSKTLSPALLAQLGRLAERDGSAAVRAAAAAALAGRDTLSSPACSAQAALLK